MDNEQPRSHLGLYLSIGCGAVVLLIGILLVIGFIALARTGLVGSAERFDVPEPSRVVEASEQTVEEVQMAIATSLLTSLKGREVELVLTEEVLTTLLRSGLDQTDGLFDASRAQVAVVDSGLEVYVPVMINERETVAIAHVVPTLAADGGIDVKTTRVQLGNLQVPISKNVRERVETTLTEALDTQLDQAQGRLTLTELQLTERAVRVKGEVNVNTP